MILSELMMIICLANLHKIHKCEFEKIYYNVISTPEDSSASAFLNRIDLVLSTDLKL
jgi:hypothetical protein